MHGHWLKAVDWLPATLATGKGAVAAWPWATKQRPVFVQKVLLCLRKLQYIPFTGQKRLTVHH